MPRTEHLRVSFLPLTTVYGPGLVTKLMKCGGPESEISGDLIVVVGNSFGKTETRYFNVSQVWMLVWSVKMRLN